MKLISSDNTKKIKNKQTNDLKQTNELKFIRKEGGGHRKWITKSLDS